MRFSTPTLILASLTLAMAACGSALERPPQDGEGGASTTVGTGPFSAATGSCDKCGKNAPSLIARDFFVATVYPLLVPTCGKCHATGQLDGPSFLEDTARGTYEWFHLYNNGALVAAPEKNLLLLKGAHEGPALDPMQVEIISHWLSLEYPGYVPPDPPGDLYQALPSFAACMDKSIFAAPIGQVVMAPTDGGCSCATCHAAAEAKGSGGQLVLDPDVDATFVAAQKAPGVLAFVQPVVGETGLFKELVPSHRLAQKGTDPTPQSQGEPNTSCSCQTALGLQVNGVIDVKDPAYCHPHYALPMQVEAELDAFVGDTLDAVKTDTCGL